ncbi:hypothetical protein JOE57_002805 [Microlunatus panaciterrae]|uniref:Uncharacterized protein n=1 Tax=Microlunatus panaciterrae TaxID=400768 RepID=A0ABS2RLJ3_9ACTN|nr:hypothetical protein [Microlunatus panaciterrae]
MVLAILRVTMTKENMKRFTSVGTEIRHSTTHVAERARLTAARTIGPAPLTKPRDAKYRRQTVMKRFNLRFASVHSNS